MEILVVLGLFVVLTTIIINIFILTLRSQRQTSARQVTLANLRYVIEKIARQVKTSEIDYDKYANISGPVNTLFLINSNGDQVSYTRDIDQRIKLIIKKDNGGEIITEESFLTDKNEIEVVNLDFYIEPTTDPFQDERCRENNDCYSYTQNPTLSCLVTKVCNGGENKGSDCQNDIDCPESTCVGPPFESGFCSCIQNNDCLTNYCEDGVCLPINYQPRVTIALAFKSQAVKAEEQKIIFLQTTISSRVYKR